MEIYKYLGSKITDCIEKYPLKKQISEIRIISDIPLQVTVYGKTESLSCIVTQREMEDIFYEMCERSINVFGEEISQGYITLKGGCRVGIAGEYSYSKSLERYVLKQLQSLNIRIPKQNIYFENQDRLFSGKITSTLVTGLPHSGKTSLLKLFIQKLCKDYRVAICDERKELYTENLSCNVLWGIEKAEAISLATRTLNPQYIVCDEIGGEKEAKRILSAVNTGVHFICSAHGESVSQLHNRPNIAMLYNAEIFDRTVVVCQKNSKFYIKDIIYA